MEQIRLVALDLDGTVFNDQKEITPRTLAAIRAALQKGVTVLPATGRTNVTVLGAVRGVGGIDSWGTDVEEAYRLDGARDYTVAFRLMLN